MSKSWNIRDFVNFPRPREEVRWRFRGVESPTVEVERSSVWKTFLDMNIERSFQLRDRRRCSFFPIFTSSQRSNVWVQEMKLE